MFEFISTHTDSADYPDESPLQDEAEAHLEALRETGDGLAQHLQHIEEAMRDFDPELAAACVRALREDAWTRAREALWSYLALAALHELDPHLDLSPRPVALGPLPAPLDASRWPAVPRKGVRKGVRALVARTNSCIAELDELQSWVSDCVAAAADWLADEDPVHSAAVLVANIGRVVERAEEIVDLWQDFVITSHRKLAATQRGLHPPRFVAFQAQLDDMLAQFKARRRTPAA